MLEPKFSVVTDADETEEKEICIISLNVHTDIKAQYKITYKHQPKLNLSLTDRFRNQRVPMRREELVDALINIPSEVNSLTILYYGFINYPELDLASGLSVLKANILYLDLSEVLRKNKTAWEIILMHIPPTVLEIKVPEKDKEIVTSILNAPIADTLKNLQLAPVKSIIIDYLDSPLGLFSLWKKANQVNTTERFVPTVLNGF